MTISVEQLLAEAREMALELRLKDKLIAAQAARLAELAPVPDSDPTEDQGEHDVRSGH
jgi:hypothetical protein